MTQTEKGLNSDLRSDKESIQKQLEIDLKTPRSRGWLLGAAVWEKGKTGARMTISAECENSWAQNSSTARFCSNCGKPLPFKPRRGRQIAGGVLLLVGMLFFISPLVPSSSPTPSSIVIGSLVISWIITAICIIFGVRLIRGLSIGGGR